MREQIVTVYFGGGQHIAFDIDGTRDGLSAEYAELIRRSVPHRGGWRTAWRRQPGRPHLTVRSGSGSQSTVINLTNVTCISVATPAPEVSR